MSFEKIIETYGPLALRCIIIIVVGLIVIKVLLKFIRKALGRGKIDVTAHKFILSISKIILFAILVIVLLDTIGVKMSSIIAVVGVAGLAISLAVQDSLTNVAGGFILLATRPFEVNDYIQIGGVEGTVIHINIVTTKLTTFDNKAIYIPNGQISKDKIINFTREPNRRLDLEVSIGYQDDFSQAQQIILDIIEKNDKALSDPKPLVRMCAHGESSIQIAVKVWVKSENYWNLKYDLLEEIKSQFDQNGIHIPYRQLDVILHQSESD
jgi:small conductance mechanosensitive channel